MTDRPLTEADIRAQFVTPALHRAGWDQATRIREEYGFTDGRIVVRGRLATRSHDRKRADYLLFYERDLPLAVVEAKDATHAVGAGMQQALEYAAMLDVPFAFSSNGSGFVMHDRTGASDPVEQHLALDAFPSPDELWRRYREAKKLTPEAERVARFPFHDGEKEPRYYQRVAIQRAVEAIATGQRRALLVMATGTGKTYTAFQIIWRLWKSGTAKRVLFLADRNILVDQTKQNDFQPFGGSMTKVEHRRIDKSFEVYLALYQAVSGTEEERNVYKQFSRDFFDLVVVDECHRGSAREESAWREILDWFEPAVHLGLTATPKETSDVSTLTYFGPAIYTYSLKQGIQDGFLAPYKVVRVDLDKDLQGWRPDALTDVDDNGVPIERRIYDQADMDRTLVLTKRTELVASKVVDQMLAVDPFGKTIVFCEDVDHAERMRSALVNEVARRIPGARGQLDRFVVRITGDSDEGKRALYDFIHPESRVPVIATTSKLLTTGVDAKTCKLVVLDQRIQSMIEFKQIVGRGTRIDEDHGKRWFTILDFKKATELFADPAFDGEPEVVIDVGTGTGGGDGGEGPDDPGPTPPPTPRVKYVLSGVEVSIYGERVQYLAADGTLITESLKDYTRKKVRGAYESLDRFLARWNGAERKKALLDELAEQGVVIEELQEQVGRDLDPLDLLCHVVYDRPPMTRKERVAQVRKRDVFAKYGEQARAVLDALLDKYADQGVLAVEDPAVLRVSPLDRMGTPMELMRTFGGKEAYAEAVRELERELYRSAG